jgi:hypothetical protein
MALRREINIVDGDRTTRPVVRAMGGGLSRVAAGMSADPNEEGPP